MVLSIGFLNHYVTKVLLMAAQLASTIGYSLAITVNIREAEAPAQAGETGAR